jgi:hypothetical protein
MNFNIDFKNFNWREFVVKKYDVVRQSEALGITLLCFIVFCFVCTSTIVMNPTVMRDIIRTVMRKEKPRVVEPPKPVVMPKDIPVNLAPPPKMQKLQKLNERMVVKKKDIKTTLKPKPIAAKVKTQLSYKGANDMGQSIRGMMYKDYGTKFNVENSGKGGIRAKIEQFVVVKYEGGDWDCEFHHAGGNINFKIGSIPNLIYEIKRKTDIDVINDTPVVVRADSQEIHKSPFVYFTGHQDFTLTDAEVENLRTYLLQGGAIVANNSLPGRRSRVDVAFRREMKRVIPDHDLQTVPQDHKIFKAFAILERVPLGVNGWAEPFEMIEIDGRVVVIYNLNDYGDLMLARLETDPTKGLVIKKGLRDDDPSLTARWQGPRVWSSSVNKRNLYAGTDDPAIVDKAYLMNINILAYLLMR